jgi:hypothetical protein
MSSGRTKPICRSDSAAIFTVLTEVAPEIPVRLDGTERLNLMRNLVEECCKGTSSWVVLDGEKIVGFLLGKDCSIRHPWLEFSGIELLYGGMLKASRGHGLFSNLIDQAKALRTPLYSVVKHANSSGMIARLTKANFVRQERSLRDDETAFVWKPSAGC